MGSRIPEMFCSYNFARSFVFCCLCLLVTGKAIADDSLLDEFVPPADKTFDWIQLTSGEWLKGDLKVLYNNKLEFDSDKLDLLELDWEDVKQVRGYQLHSVRFEGPEIVVGILKIINEKVW